MSGDDYAALNSVDSIDFLKIDVEGAEKKVLRGFKDMLGSRAIRLIQFEYNRGAIIGDFLLKDAYEFFSAFGYKLGKLVPEGVLFHDYHYSYENFVGPNYVACREDDIDLQNLISVS